MNDLPLIWTGLLLLAFVVRGHNSKDKADRFYAGVAWFFLVFVQIMFIVSRWF